MAGLCEGGNEPYKTLNATNIRMLVDKFKRTGSFLEEKRSGRPQTSANDFPLLQHATERSPGASTRPSPGPITVTSPSGKPLESLTASLTVGPYGPTLFQDIDLIQGLSHVARVKIPERLVHAKGAVLVIIEAIINVAVNDDIFTEVSKLNRLRLSLKQFSYRENF
ncbi:hypothetical protein ANN_26545 [Periplaneta americana]|uniref:Catalase core domain-containing protein n=1 Tax=Periplaneta americana TaxID=6978 RepID=A0ABQ8RYD1_PERAM|nr:hypothetical protein ANN_26545 [Periplaneta americana]